MVEKIEEKIDYKYLSIVVSATVILSLVLIFTLGQYSWSQMQGAITEANSQSATLKSDQDRLGYLQTLSSQSDKIKTENQTVLGALPQDKDISGLFVQFEQIANESGMTISSVSETNSPAATSSNQAVRKTTYSVIGKASDYTSFKQALSKFENALRILSITDINLTSQTGINLDTTFNITTYSREGN